jgi:outer membrane protein assembly factor BamB
MQQIWKGLLMVLLVLWPALEAGAEDWPNWRGPRGDGSSLEKGVPLQWNETENVAWKAEVPGTGHASPIVFKDKIFIVSALLDTQERVLLCFDRKSGKKLWQKTVVESPLERKHELNSFASSTPATDGTNVYVAFLSKDKMVAAAYDLEGNEKWSVSPGVFSSIHGFCSSPIIHKDKVILNGDHDGDSYIVAISRADGRTLWKTPRENKTRSYCVPTVFELSGRTQMVLSGDKSVASYDPNNGKLHWILDGPTEQFVASIVYNQKADLLFVTGGYPDLHILGLKHDGKGKIGREKIAWRSNKGVSYVPSPVSVGDWFFIVSDGGIASCYDARSGKIEWQERLAGGHHASLVTAEERVYFLGDNGECTIVQAAKEFNVLAKNVLQEKFFASPAISQGQIFLRGDKHLYCIQSSK